MKIRFHPVADNPIRMAYVSGWTSIEDLVRRLDRLEREIGIGRVCPAPWEPFFKEWPTCRHAGIYAWARAQLEDSAEFPVHLALFPDVDNPCACPMSRANWELLSVRTETSRITQELMTASALEMWETSATGWLEQIVERCASLGIGTSVSYLREQALGRLSALMHAVPGDEIFDLRPEIARISQIHGFDPGLLQMDGWTPDPGTIILPVDGLTHGLAHEILLLNVHQVALLRGQKLARCVGWEMVTLIYLSEGSVVFDIRDESPLVVAGYEHPDQVLRTVQECHRTATERILQAVATQVIRVTP
jgi:hypothetical protein